MLCKREACRAETGNYATKTQAKTYNIFVLEANEIFNREVANRF